jgi:hypothetical protein
MQDERCTSQCTQGSKCFDSEFYDNNVEATCLAFESDLADYETCSRISSCENCKGQAMSEEGTTCSWFDSVGCHNSGNYLGQEPAQCVGR